jgi:hypothetical protein
MHSVINVKQKRSLDRVLYILGVTVLYTYTESFTPLSLSADANRFRQYLDMINVT